MSLHFSILIILETQAVQITTRKLFHIAIGKQILISYYWYSTAADSFPAATKAASESTTAASFFSVASHTDASRAIFVDGSRDTHNQYIYGEETDTLLATLEPVDRSGNYVQPCIEGTRLSVLDRWLDDINERNILWLNGLPGSGKSTIASSLISRLAARGQLGSAFFFKRGDVTLSDPTAVWRTVAYDLAQRDHTFARHLVEALKRRSVDPGRPDITLHFRHLVKEPLIRSSPRLPLIIIIDALDECGSDISQIEQRRIFIDTITQWSSLPGRYKLIVTGRDQRMPDTFRAVCKCVTLSIGDIDDEVANRDIRYFFEVRFAEFGDVLSPELRQGRVFDALTTRATGLFIWADTVVRFMEQSLAEERLLFVLNGSMGGDSITSLYRQILEFSFREADDYTLQTFRRVVAAILMAKAPFHGDELSQFISQPSSSVNLILEKLSPVISTVGNRLYIRHLSFSEFLCDRDRCPKQFYVPSYTSE